MIEPQNPNGRESDTSLDDLVQGTTIHAALSFYDLLPSVTVEEMIGAWKGAGIPTGNPFDGLLEAFGWHGKRFDSADASHPLIFDTPTGARVQVNPAFMPMALVLRFSKALRTPMVAQVLRLILPVLGTRKPKARLRMMEYRGVVTGTMSYDDLPIHDAFRKVDDDTLLGAMDLRDLDHPFMFILRRENPHQESGDGDQRESP
jgi:hypothetical protein